MNFAFRLMFRDIRSGDLLTLLLALVISVSTVTSIGLFIDRLQLSFEQESANLLAADRLIRSDDDIPKEWEAKANELSLQAAQRTSFTTMMFAGDSLQLSQLSAVTDSYPLKGAYLVDDVLFGTGKRSTDTPKQGEIWVSSRLASLLKLNLGDQVEVGDASLKVSQYLVRDPGSSTSAFAISPRAVMNMADLAATNVIIPGSRVRYSLLLAGSREALDEYENWITPRLSEGQRWQTPTQRGERIGDTIGRAESFLLLAGTLAVVMSGVAMALASARFVKRHLMQVAILKTIGATPKLLGQLFLLQLSILFMVGALIGLGIGWGLQEIIASLLSGLMSTTLPEPSISRLWLGAATGLISMVVFCLPLMSRLIKISPLSVLQPNARIELNGFAIYVIGFIGMFGLMCLYTNGFLLPSIMTAAILGIALFVAAIGWLAFKLGRSLTSGATSGWQIGLASLYRRLIPNLFQLLVFTLIIMLTLILIGVKSSLIADWQQQLPEDAPNHYLFNVQANQIDQINSDTTQLGLKKSDWYPMVRGRVTAVNNTTIQSLYPEERGEPELYERELNLTWSDTLGKGNELVEGDFFAEGLSVELKAAKEANLEMGDELTINIGGNIITLPITSIRTVDWGSMQPNFYLILPKSALEDYPANFVSSLFISDAQAQAFYRAMAHFPTVSILNVGDILKQIQTIVGQLSQAIQLVLLCILSAGALVLLASVRSTLEERLEEGALLRVLGARGALVRQALLVEFGALGFFAGLIAAIGAETCLLGLQVFVFNAEASFHPLLWLLGPAIGIVVISTIGIFASRTVLKVPPVLLLRGL
ncbi:FtsX-like permease family protein [Marinomonas rhizomae]|uniref:Putative ABC transport system permease protein n=1 Tax=Marinomonas rhizomae TaxID=491948 RepID=A0A366JEB4_9GAMM|nr:FtsX-like permease family protein [Marinomonas rhizomae]RBP84729.1 putative ABC transport system permease protein [Marinomonas rhizomae]RNF75072.1 FtsX-like permease family protein [Marinomonas rhizomae]